MYSIKQAQEFFKSLEGIFDQFVQLKRLESEKWHDVPGITLGTNLHETNFFGMRRQVEIYIKPDKDAFYIFGRAYSDGLPGGRKLKDAYVSRHPMNLLPEQFLYYLEIAWRVANSITEKELLVADEWQQESRQRQLLLLGEEVFEK